MITFTLTKQGVLRVKKIAITGGPSTGKTALIEQLQKKGYPCFHEIIREMTLEAKRELHNKAVGSNPLTFVKDPFAFNKKILDGRTQQFLEADTFSEPVVFFDRGIPDVLAYMDFFKQDYPQSFENSCHIYQYHQVFILPPWEAIFKSDNERMESFQEGIAIHQHLSNTYKKFGYHLLSIPEGSIEERIQFIITRLKKQ